jgi:AcrR family transcriptional regulator
MREMATTAILAAAEAVVAEQGVDNARMEEIARRAGIAVGTMYNYFADRDALMGALSDARKRELLDALNEALATGEAKPFRAQLELFLRALLEYYEQHRQFFMVLLGVEAAGSLPPPRKRETMKQLWTVADKLMQRGVRAGALRSAHAELLPGLLFGMVRGGAMTELHRVKSTPLTDLVAPLLELFLHGAAAPARAR